MLVPLMMLVACSPLVESVESESVRTSGLYADYSVEVEDSGEAEVHAYLKLGSSTSTTYVNLGSGDRLSASAGGTTTDLRESNLGELYGYHGELPVNSPGTAVTISLERAGDDSAPDSSCTLPEVPTISAPADGARFSRSADDLTITWAPADEGDIEVEVSGLCIDSYDQRVSDDTGSLTIEAGVLFDEDEAEDDDCDVTVRVIRASRGSLDDALEGGTISCEQHQTIELTATP